MRLADLSPEEQLKALEKRVVDPAVSPEFLVEAQGLYDNSPDPDVRGAAGFLLLAKRIEALRIVPEKDSDEFERLATLLADSTVQDSFRRFYVIPDEYRIADAVVHDLGTTSVILRCPAQGSGDVALKCLLPKFATLPSVMDATRRYHELSNELWSALPDPGRDRQPPIPEVFYSNDRSMAMTLIRAKTLQSLIEVLEQADAEDEAESWELRLDLVERLLPALCALLGTLAAHDLHHLDLSPGNILVQVGDISDVDTLRPEEITLIDFGFNYLLTDIATRDSRAERALTFIAPELGDRGPENQDLSFCDIYSLGALALEILTPHALDRSRIREAMAVLWAENAGMAALVEDLVDEAPEKRLLRCAPDHRKQPFTYLADALELEAKIARAFAQRPRRMEEERSGAKRLLRKAGVPELRNMLRPRPLALEDLERVRKVIDDQAEVARELGHRPSERTLNRLILWLRAHEIAWWIALVLGVALSVAELGNVGDWIGGLPGPAIDFLTAQGVVGAPSEHLAARIVALTTALLAYGYYTTIFAPLAFRDLQLGRTSRFSLDRARLLETSARYCCLAAIVAQIAWLFFPLPPAIIGGAAGILIGVNNLLFLKLLVHRADRKSRKGGPKSERRFSTVGDDFTRFVTSFGPWWWLMGLYSGAGALLGVGLLLGLLEDLWAYAILMAVGVNYLKLFLLNVVSEGPRVQSNLARASELLIRAKRLDASSPEPS